MQRRFAALTLAGAIFTALTLSPRVRERLPPHAVAAHGGLAAASPCAARLLSELRSLEAWTWSLCFDQRGACAGTFAVQLQQRPFRLWLTCAAQGAGP